MNKKSLTLLTGLALTISAQAQSYDRLWKKADEATANDLPKSALLIANKVYDKAVAEHNDAQLLKAVLMQRIYQCDISPDSAEVCIQRMEQALACEQRPVVQALWHTALARIYADGVSLYDDSQSAKTSRTQALDHARAALSQPTLLADTPAADYLPLFIKGKDSGLFGNDLLHVVYFTLGHNSVLSDSVLTKLRPSLIALYEQRGESGATLQLTLDSLATVKYDGERSDAPLEQRTIYRELLALAQKYEALPLNVLTYDRLIGLAKDYRDEDAEAIGSLLTLARRGVELYGKKGNKADNLRNFIAERELPSVKVSELCDSYLPGAKADIHLQTRNTREVNLRLTRVAASWTEMNSQSDVLPKLLKQYRRQATELTYQTDLPNAWTWTDRDEAFAVPDVPGVYCLEVLEDGKQRDAHLFSVTRVCPITFAVSESEGTRVVVVDAVTGHPLPGARIKAVDSEGRQLAAYATDSRGQTVIVPPSGTNYYYSTAYYASTADDQAARSFSLSSYRSYRRGSSDDARTETTISLFTDRGIYRPGQKLHFSGTAYKRQGDDFNVIPKLEMRVTLYNANRKAIDSLTVRTDEWGTLDGTFTLPEATLPGTFFIEAQGASLRGSHYVRVEEYKRPTFTAETRPVTRAYALGDTVEVEGEAKTYTGVPIAGAKVKYTVRRGSWYRSSRGDVKQTGETVTDSEGHFVLPVELWATADERRSDRSRYDAFYYEAEYTVTADNGETVQGSATLRAAVWKSRIDLSEVPDKVAKEHLPRLVVKQYNAAGQELTVDGTYTLTSDGAVRTTGHLVTGQPLDTSTWLSLPSGNYELVVRTDDEALPDTARFVLFSEADTRPADRHNPFFAYSRVSPAGDEAVVRVGSKAPHSLLYYDLVAGGRIVESRSIELSDSLFKLDLHYLPEYGDGAKAFFALVRDNQFYTFTTEVRKPEPDKRLVMQWTSFRSRLTPGAREEWHLKVTYPDGRPAQAMVLARMYDASLDALVSDRQYFGGIYFPRYLPNGSWSWTRPNSFNILTAFADYDRKYAPPFGFTSWSESLLRERNIFYDSLPTVVRSRSARLSKSYVQASLAAMPDGAEAKMAADNRMVVSEQSGGAQQAAPSVKARTNFAETAFFMPRLVTDAKGEVSIAFTLPESTTTWNVKALAHDRQMNYGSADTTVVARKEFMVEPALPRYVRRGDHTVLPVKVTNLTNKSITARLALTLTDALADSQSKPAFSRQQSVTLAPGESRVYGFDYDATAATSMLVCRAVAEGGGFSDGEEHYLPVLDDRVEVTRTLPFTLRQRGTTELRVDTLFSSPRATDRSFTVELSSSPLWYAVSALPSLAGDANSLSAPEWATRYYALALGLHVAEQNPEVGRLASADTDELDALNKLNLDGLTDATPWLNQGEREARRRAELRRLFDPEVSAARRYTAIDKLRMLQRPDGAWSWYPGMPGNVYITVDVAITLARVQRMTGDKAAAALLQSAYEYLEKEMADQVAKVQAEEKRRQTKLMPTEAQMRYLYLRCFMGERPDDTAKYLIDRAAQLRREYTMYGKAVMAVVMAESGREDEAKLNLQSLMEHTVSTDEMGRYFDTPRAECSWQSYRIPTQCAAIEALDYFGRKDEAAELRLWLLQSKRTQLWETSRASADAVYALLTEQADSSVTGSLDKGGQSLWFTLKRGQQIVGLNAPSDTDTPTTVGYVRQTFTDPSTTAATTVKLRKDSDGLSWGSVYATFTQPESEVTAEGKGLTVTQTLEVKRGAQWQPLTEGTVLAKGDRVRRVFTLTADRDYDFVCLDAQRAACLATVRPLSGYDWGGGLPAYRAVGDASTRYFFEQVRKGTHSLSEELFADRAGTYAMGLCKVQCVYAPEFTGTAAALTVKAE